MVAESVISDAEQEIQEQSQSISEGRLARRDHFPYRIQATQAKMKGQSQWICKVCADSGKLQTGKSCKEAYNTVLPEV